MIKVIRLTFLGLATTIAIMGCSPDTPAPPPADSDVNSNGEQGSGDKGSETGEPARGSGSSY